MKFAMVGFLLALLCLWQEVKTTELQEDELVPMSNNLPEAFRLKRGSCSCSTSGTQTSCSCCQGIKGFKACAEVTIMASGVGIKIKLGGATVFDDDLIGASGPGDFCVKKSGFKFCFDFYNVDLSDLSDPDMCIKVKAKVLNKTVARVNLGCI